MVEAYIAGVAAAVLWVCCLYEVARVLVAAIEIWRDSRRRRTRELGDVDDLSVSA